jgi:hypothetical protein
LAIILAMSLCRNAGAVENLQEFFNVPQVQASPIGKLKADSETATCSHLVSRLPTMCIDGSYAAQCVSGLCGCINYTCTNSGGTSGTGAGTMEIGFDFANGPTLGLAPDCYPIFGVYIVDTGKKDKAEEETDFDGVACDPLSGAVTQIVGGWQLVSFDESPSLIDGAGGTLTGTLNMGSSALKVVFKGQTF